MEAIGKCMICRQPTAFYADWLCKPCYNEWPELHLPFADWPQWARFLKRYHQQERRAERRRLGYVDDAGRLQPPYEDDSERTQLVYERLCYGEYDEDVF